MRKIMQWIRTKSQYMQRAASQTQTGRAQYLLNRDNDRFAHAHIHTKNYSPETECRLMRSLTETGGDSGGDLRRTPQQNLFKNRTEKKRKEKAKQRQVFLQLQRENLQSIQKQPSKGRKRPKECESETRDRRDTQMAAEQFRQSVHCERWGQMW